MKILIRDFKIIWSATWQMLLWIALANVFFLIAVHIVDSAQPEGATILTFKAFLIIAGIVDAVIIGTIIYDYITVWRKHIQYRIDEAEREKKYNFISQRFNEIN